MVGPIPGALASSLQWLLKTGQYSDLKLKCGDKIYAVHKAIVCSQSKFFEAAYGFGGIETETKSIELADVEEDIAKRLVQYLYEGEYEPELNRDDIPRNLAEWKEKYSHSCGAMDYYSRCTKKVCEHHQCGYNCSNNCQKFTCIKCGWVEEVFPKTTGPAEQMITHASLFEIADRYGIYGLLELSENKFRQACSEYWNDDSFAVAADIAFTTTPDSNKALRNIVTEVISQHMDLLIKPEIEALLIEFNGIATGILKHKQAEGCFKHK